MLRVLIPLESVPGETRVAASPESTKKLLTLGCEVDIEQGAGISAGFSDESYRAIGASIVSPKEKNNWNRADLLLCVQSPGVESLSKLKEGALIIGLLSPYSNNSLKEVLESGKLSAMSLELLPRISRAQSADALSSQANIAGYKSVLIAASALDRYFPMLMTAAGTIQPARVVVLGAGVAGLQAVATAKRLGSVVFVSDIRAAVKEQVESLGARFIEPPSMDEKPLESDGYAKQASQAFLLAQRKQLSYHLSEADVAICTAQVPGKRAPQLIDEEMLDHMRPGSVVVDLAVANGGNCACTQVGETVVRQGVKLIGADNLPCTVPNHASSLYARNLLALLDPLLKKGDLNINQEDDLIAGCLISYEGVIKFSDIFSQGGNN